MSAADYAHVSSCLQVDDAMIADALASARRLDDPSPRQKSLALIARMAEVARPGKGAPKILLVLAHMALRDWIEGELRVRLIGDPEVTVMELLVDDGFSATRLLGPLRVDVPFEEFRRGLELHPDMVLPLGIDGKLEARRVELVSSRPRRLTSKPPSFSAVSPSLLPFLSGGDRKLPEIVSRPPGNPIAAERPAAAPEERRVIKPMSLPPHMKEALAPIKKK